MRDLEKYPITHDEVIRCLEWLKASHHPNHTHLVGDMTPLLLEEAIKIVKWDKEEHIL